MPFKPRVLTRKLALIAAAAIVTGGGLALAPAVAPAAEAYKPLRSFVIVTGSLNQCWDAVDQYARTFARKGAVDIRIQTSCLSIRENGTTRYYAEITYRL